MSPRKSRSKSLWASSNITGTPALARSSDSITPAGPPPTIQQVVFRVSSWCSSMVAPARAIVGSITGRAGRRPWRSPESTGAAEGPESR